jgi:hypothetical protein
MAVDETPKRSPGRPVGWRKNKTLTSRITMRIPQHLEEWLLEQAEPKGLSVSDIARMILLEAKLKAEKEKAKEG